MLMVFFLGNREPAKRAGRSPAQPRFDTRRVKPVLTRHFSGFTADLQVPHADGAVGADLRDRHSRHGVYGRLGCRHRSRRRLTKTIANVMVEIIEIGMDEIVVSCF